MYGPSGYDAQASFLKGQPTYRGTPGSTRPDLYRSGEAIEIKNYDVSTSAGQNRLVSNVVDQARTRAQNLPAADVQKLIIDVRGQNIGTATLNRLADEIATRSDGVLSNLNITFWR